MAIVVKLTGDLSDLEAKLKSAGVKVEQFGDDSESAGKKAKAAFDSDLERSIKNIEEATGTLASHAGGMNELAEGFGNTERVALGLNDIMGVMAEQFGVNLGPAQEYAQAIGDVAGGLEGVIGGGMALVEQLKNVVPQMVPAIASTWAHVTALYAQATATIAANLPLIAIIATFALLAAGVVLVVKHWDEIVEKFPILGEAADAIKAKLDEFTGWIRETFVPGVMALYEGVKDAVEQAIKFVVDHWDEIRAVIQPGIEALTAIIQAQIDVWVIIFQTVVGVIKGIIDVFIGVFTGDWQRAWDGIKQIMQSTWDGITGIVGTAIDLIKNLWPIMKEAATALGGALKDGFIEGVKGTIGVIGNLADKLLEALKSLINSAIGEVNAAIPNSLTISVLGKDIGVDLPDNPIPRLARGMWDVPGPNGVDQFPALLAGGEMVLPAPIAEAVRQSISVPGATSGGGTTTIRIGVATDGVGDPVDDLTKLLRLLAALDEQAREMWLADPDNQLFLENLKRAAAGLPPISAGSVGPPPSIYPTAPTGPHPERGGGYGGGLPIPTKPRPGDTGGTASGGGAPRVTPGGGAKADEEMMAVLVEIRDELTKANRQRANVLNVLKEPVAVNFMTKTDPKTFVNMLAPFIVDAIAQLQRRTWSPA